MSYESFIANKLAKVPATGIAGYARMEKARGLCR